MLGASALTGLSAMRSGAGLTTIAVPKSLQQALQKKISNVIMTLPLPETVQGSVSLPAFNVLKEKFPKYASVAIGPGMTTASGTVKFVEKMYCDCPLAMVVDADALNALAGKLDDLKKPKAVRILTPHPGEMSRLTGLSRDRIAADRKGVALAYAKRWGCILVLKGQGTVAASPQGKVYVNTTGNAGMSTAGSGDVLTGMIAAFCAQGVSPFEACRLGVFLHGKAGDLAARHIGKVSLIATDILQVIPTVLQRGRHV